MLALNTLFIQLCPWPLFVHGWVLTSQSIILNSLIDPRSGMLCSNLQLRLRVAHWTVDFMAHISVHRSFARINRPFVYPFSIHFSARKNHKSAENIDLKVILRWRFGGLTTWDSPYLRQSKAKAYLVVVEVNIRNLFPLDNTRQNKFLQSETNSAIIASMVTTPMTQRYLYTDRVFRPRRISQLTGWLDSTVVDGSVRMGYRY
jgi:hypothetical protein